MSNIRKWSWTNPALLLLLVMLGACKDEARQGYVELTGRIMLFNPRLATATYVVTLDRLRDIPDGSRVIAWFDNPAGGDKLRIEQKVWPNATRIAIESAPLHCVRKGRAYAFSVRLVGPSGEDLQLVEASITSTLDQTILPDAPLVVGPAYEPNPALKGDPAGKIKGQPAPVCPT